MDDATQSAAVPDDALRAPPFRTPMRSRRGRALLATAGRFLHAMWVQSVVVLMLAVLLAPAVAFCAAGIWSIVTYVMTVRALFELVQRFALAPAFARLSMLDAALRIGLVSTAYFAVVSSSMVLAAGVLGRRRRPTLLLAGLLLMIPSTLIFTLSARLTAEALGSRFGLAAPVLPALFLYALFDAALVGTLLVDTRPRRARARRRWLRRARAAEVPVLRAATTHSTPMIRFGPAQPLNAPLPQDAPDELDEEASPQLQLASEPSILIGAVDEPARNATAPEDASAQPVAGVGTPTPPGA